MFTISKVSKTQERQESHKNKNFNWTRLERNWSHLSPVVLLMIVQEINLVQRASASCNSFLILVIDYSCYGCTELIIWPDTAWTWVLTNYRSLNCIGSSHSVWYWLLDVVTGFYENETKRELGSLANDYRTTDHCMVMQCLALSSFTRYLYYWHFADQLIRNFRPVNRWS